MEDVMTVPKGLKMTMKQHQLEIQKQLQAAGVPLEMDVIRAVYDSFVEVIGSALEQGNSVVVPGLGRFELRHRNPMSFVSPKTKKKVFLSERYVPFCLMGSKLKKRVRDYPLIPE